MVRTYNNNQNILTKKNFYEEVIFGTFTTIM